MSVDPVKQAALHRLMVVSAVIIAVAGIVVGFALGRYQAIRAIGATPAEIEILRQKASEHDTAVESCTDRLNTTMLERDVALSSAEEMKKTVTLREQDAADQQDLVKNYRQVISARGGLALNVQKITINALPEHAFEYQLDLSQINGGRKIIGQVAIKLIGGGQELIVPMPQTNFNFDYVQRLKGSWTMPAGFTPQFVDVHITQGGMITTQRYAWQVGAVIPNMPDTLLEYQEANTLKTVSPTDGVTAKKEVPAKDAIPVADKPKHHKANDVQATTDANKANATDKPTDDATAAVKPHHAHKPKATPSADNATTDTSADTSKPVVKHHAHPKAAATVDTGTTTTTP